MKLADLVGQIDGVQLAPGAQAGAGQIRISGLAADSRAVAPGFLFAALEGVDADGAAFIPDAISRGAAAVLARSGVPVEGVPLISARDPRAALAHLAAAFYPRQPGVICAVTGTNGKTSVASFVRQLWAASGERAASLGTLGVVTDAGADPLHHTTPDPIEIHRRLDALVTSGVTHLAMEASSHGLAQYRLDCVKIQAGALTNITRDHLDYHDSFRAYRDAKLRLFTDVIADGGAAVLNADCDSYEAACSAANARGLRVIDVGAHAKVLNIHNVTPGPAGLQVRVSHGGETFDIALPLVGGFQASNALVAAGLAMAGGTRFADLVPHLEALTGAEGRMELVASFGGASVFVDYAHTPDALETVLRAVRPHTEGRLVVVFGAGGDRDKGKRPQMGAVATRHADKVIVTDDNPRGEAPDAIRADVMAAAPGAQEIGDRAEAIAVGLKSLQAGDVLVIAGKGHESGQTIKDVTYPFKDKDEVLKFLGQS